MKKIIVFLLSFIVAMAISNTVFSQKLPFKTGDRIFLQSDDGHYLSRIHRGGINPIEAAKKSPDVYCEFKVNVLTNGKITLQSDDGHYLSRIHRGGINPIEAAKKSPDVYCEFKVNVLTNGKITLQSDDGHYLSRIHRGGINPIEAAKKSPDVFCQFRVVINETPLPFKSGDIITLRADNGKYLSRIARETGIESIEAAKNVPDIYCNFTVTILNNGKIALKADNGKYLSRIFRNNFDRIDAKKDSPDGDSQFDVEVLGNNFIMLKADNGHYLRRLNPSGIEFIGTLDASIQIENRFVVETGFEVLGLDQKLNYIDFNGDGKTDIFLIFDGGWKIMYGGHNFWTELNYNGGPISVESLRFGDFNGDGKTDIFLIYDGGWKIMYGGQNFWTELNYTGGGDISMKSLRFGDFNGDGKTDIFFIGNGWKIMYGGQNFWTELNYQDKSIEVESLRFGDFNGDGKTDIFLIFDGGWKIMYGGHNFWTELNYQDKSIAVESLRFGDFNGDGKTDIFLIFDGGWKIMYGGHNFWTELNYQDKSIVVESLRFGDFNGDTKTDIFLIFDGGWKVMYGGHNFWTELNYQDQSIAVESLRFGDFNGDTKTDIFLIFDGGWKIMYGGQNFWTELNYQDKSIAVESLRFGDFNKVDGLYRLYDMYSNLFWSSVPKPADSEYYTSIGNQLPTGATLGIGNKLVSLGGRFEARLQPDGNFCLYDYGKGIWCSNTSGHPRAQLVQHADGGLKLYQDGVVVWDPVTKRAPENLGNSVLTLENSGFLTVCYYDSEGAQVLWKTQHQTCDFSSDISCRGVSDILGLIDDIDRQGRVKSKIDKAIANGPTAISKATGSKFTPFQTSCYKKEGRGVYIFGNIGPGVSPPAAIMRATIYIPYPWINGEMNFSFIKDQLIGIDCLIKDIDVNPSNFSFFGLNPNDLKKEVRNIYNKFGDFAICGGYNTRTKNLAIYIIGDEDIEDNAVVEKLVDFWNSIPKGSNYLFPGAIRGIEIISDESEVNDTYHVKSGQKPIVFFYFIGNVRVRFE